MEKTMEKRIRVKDQGGSLDKLMELRKEHPDYPIIPMVDNDLMYNVAHSVSMSEVYWMGRLGDVQVKKLYSGNQEVHEYVERPGGNTLYTTMEDSRYSESELEQAEEDSDYARELYNALPWQDCIVIYIDTP